MNLHHHHHKMPMASSVALMHLFGQDSQIEMQYEFLGQVMTLSITQFYLLAQNNEKEV